MQSRFQSSLQSGLQSDYAKSTSSFFSNILTTTTSKYNTLKHQLISSEADGDSEDDSHIARGLRAYYAEKGRQFPEWLPPDPKAPLPPQPTQFVSSSREMVSHQAYGGQPQQAATGSGRWGRSGGGLSDLWGDPNRNSASAAPDSLRQRPGMMQSNFSGSDHISSEGGRFGNSTSNVGRSEKEIQSRPLPSQRVGSYQSQGAGGSSRFDTPSPPSSSGAGTAQDRLKARLFGRTASPPPSNASMRHVASSDSRNPYENAGSSGRGNGNPYASRASGSGLGAGGGSAKSRPVVGANSPSSQGGDHGNGGAGYDQAGGRTGGGLPFGPRAGRQGLPNGPRPQRF